LIGQTGLTADHGSMTNAGAATEANLSNDQAILANGYVVPDLDHVIKFASSSDPSFAQSAAINTAARANLNVVLQYNVPERVNANDFVVIVLD
jgi:hypothetical protein